MSADNNNTLALAPETALSAEQQAAILKTLNLNPTDPKTQALMMVCNKYGLDPLLKHAIIIPNQGMYITRDGLMHVAHASLRFDGMEVESLAETSTHFVARASVWRKDMARPFTFDGRFPKSKPMGRDYGPEMAQKVAICRALRHAFDVSLCSREETWEVEFEEEYPEHAQAQRGGQVRPTHAAPPARPALPSSDPAPAPAKRQPTPQEIEAISEFGETCSREGIDVMDDGPDPKFSKTKMAAEVRRLLSLKPDAEVSSIGMWKAATAKLKASGPVPAAPAKAAGQPMRRTTPEPLIGEGEDFEDPFEGDFEGNDITPAPANNGTGKNAGF